MGHINPAWTAKTIKGAANGHRVKILVLLDKTADLSVGDLAEKLYINFRTASEHTKKLTNAGLISKKYQQNFVTHTLTPLGKKLLSAVEKINV